jgi:hypothetical protein
MIYKRVNEYGEYILEELDETLVWPNGDPIPDEKIVVFLSRKTDEQLRKKVAETSSSMSQDQQSRQPTDHS